MLPDKQEPSLPSGPLAIARAGLYINCGMVISKPSHRLTEPEYLELERAAEFKSEFFDGERFAMAGGTPQHSLIATNLAREFGNRLASGSCVAYNTDLRIKVEATGLYTYPDLS